MVNFQQFMKKFEVKEKGHPCNYTNIGDPSLGVYPAKYNIPDEKVNEFYKIYKKYVFENNLQAYLTEKQPEVGKILIDLDFRYLPEIMERQHTKEHVEEFIGLCISGFDEIFENIQGKKLEFYIFEKDDVNTSYEDKTKDGIHIIINVECDFAVKLLLRKYLIDNICETWNEELELELTNDWESVIDDGVMKGHVNWQLYGSQKPGNEPYKLKYIYEAIVDKNNDIDLESVNVASIDFETYFPYFCARNRSNLNNFRIAASQKDAYEKFKQELMFKQGGSRNKGGLKFKKKHTKTSLEYGDISSQDQLDVFISEWINDNETGYREREVYNYTMILTPEYWGPGSYTKWISVGWALRNCGDVMYLTWLKMSSQSEEFDWNNHDLYERWQSFDYMNKEGLTYKSIIYWAKTCNPKEFQKIHQSTVDFYIYYSYKSKTDWDFATVLYHMFKDNFVCASIKDRVWYEFVNHRWKSIDSGVTLRSSISTVMYKEYKHKLLQFQTQLNAKQHNISTEGQGEQTNSKDNINILNGVENKVMEEFNKPHTDDESFGDYKSKMNSMIKVCEQLKSNSKKVTIMKEAQDMFHDDEFLKKLDTNPYILGCTNCVIDFKEKKHRKGRHDDYLKKSTNLMYKPLQIYEKECPTIIEEIHAFMNQLFPNDSLREYMWQHLASTLIGTNLNQTFNIYTGSGANGKSKLVELMSLVLGEYKGTVPISLVTDKRRGIGGTSSEVYNLIGTRYAVMQEPSKGDKINEGIMKELTGGDPIQCRALFKDSVEFIPQFKLVVCTNTLFDVVSNDDGTWRRLRKVDFQAKFCEKPYITFTREECPHQFPIDTELDKKFPKWAPVLLSLLVNIAYKTQGKVDDVDIVVEATKSYREDQDILFQFYREMVQPNPDPERYPNIKDSKDLVKKFREYSTGNGVAQSVNPQEIKAFFVKHHGNPVNKEFKGIMWKLNEDDMEINAEMAA